MLILLSPAKTFTKNTVLAKQTPLFMNKANYLTNIINNYTINEVKDNFKISEKLAITTLDYFKNINNDNQAIYLYGGTAFKYLDATTINYELLSNIYVLSGLYGIVNAYDGISPYRLEIASTFLGNLYDYWNNEVNSYLKNKNDLIINLASSEYSKYLDFKNLNILTINFIEVKDGKASSNSMMLKKMRGLMARYLVLNNITNIINIEIEGFKYNKELSNNKEYIFLKEN